MPLDPSSENLSRLSGAVASECLSPKRESTIPKLAAFGCARLLPPRPLPLRGASALGARGRRWTASEEPHKTACDKTSHAASTTLSSSVFNSRLCPLTAYFKAKKNLLCSLSFTRRAFIKCSAGDTAGSWNRRSPTLATNLSRFASTVASGHHSA